MHKSRKRKLFKVLNRIITIQLILLQNIRDRKRKLSS